MTTRTEPSSYYTRPAERQPNPSSPYEGDLLNRKSLGDRLLAVIDKLPSGAVISIDAPWGDGKTWFARSFQASLESKQFTTCYIDCFQRDYVDDPFSVLTGAFVELAERKKSPARKALIETGKKVGVALLPAAAKFAANSVGHVLLGQSGLADDIVKQLESLNQKGSEHLERMVADRLQAFRKDQETLSAFRTKLAQLASEEDKPIVIILDELDRCRPDFSIAMLERIKHFFEVPKIVFVLMINRNSLEAAIRGRYGSTFDSKAYLEKFIQLPLTLAKQSALAPRPSGANYCLLMDRLRAINLNGPDVEAFAFVASGLANFFNMPLRSMERAAILFAMSGLHGIMAQYTAWPIILKLYRPDLFNGIRRGERSAHSEAATLLASIPGEHSNISHIAQSFGIIHGKILDPNITVPNHFEAVPSHLRFESYKEFCEFVFSKVDLPLE